MYIFFQVLKTGTSILAILIFVYTVVLAFIRPKMREKGHMTIFRLMCAVPFLAALVHLYFCFFRGENGFGMTMSIYKYIYIEALLPLLLMLNFNGKLLRRITSAVLCAAVFGGGILMILNQIDYSKIHNYTSLSRSESFKKTAASMRREYCLGDWKEIDYDALLSEFLPKIEAAEKNGDKAAYGAALTEYAYRFYDGHVTAVLLDDDIDEQTRELLAGNDYGFSMFTLTNGETIAVCVDTESEAYKAGIQNGTVITKWNGEAVDKAAARVECIYPTLQFPVKENEDLFRPIFLAGKGGDNVKVTYLDEGGKETEITLPSQGSYRMRLELAVGCFMHAGVAVDDSMTEEEIESLLARNKNYGTAMLSENCGYLRITKERYDTLSDNISVVRNGYYPKLTAFYDEKLEELKAQGMDRLVIDIRNNSGGYDTVGGALASLFTNDKQFLFAFGYRTSDGCKRTEDIFVYPNGKWSELPVIVLVNQECASAGDGMADCLGKLPNVTLMGITASNGVNQNNGGCCFLADLEAVIVYPDYLTLGEDNLPLIDTDASRECRIPLDVRIPVDKEAALKIFEYEGDYELDFAMAYFDTAYHSD